MRWWFARHASIRSSSLSRCRSVTASEVLGKIEVSKQSRGPSVLDSLAETMRTTKIREMRRGVSLTPFGSASYNKARYVNRKARRAVLDICHLPLRTKEIYLLLLRLMHLQTPYAAAARIFGSQMPSTTPTIVMASRYSLLALLVA